MRRRADQVVLTEAGEALRVRAPEVLEACDARFQSALDAEEQTAMRRMLRSLIEPPGP